jgi:hypothetical protein
VGTGDGDGVGRFSQVVLTAKKALLMVFGAW